jgi:hypothetical protein
VSRTKALPPIFAEGLQFGAGDSVGKGKPPSSNSMKQKLTLLLITVLVAAASPAFAHDQFPNQPNVQGAYNRIMAVLTQLEKAKLESPEPHVKNAIIELDGANTFLTQATNNKGTYLHTAKGLCDQAKTALQATPPDIDKATELTNRALHEVNMAGQAGAHR